MPRTVRPLAALAAGAIGATCLTLSPVGAALAAPGQDPAPLAGVQLSEIESNGGTPGDWIEFRNIGDTAVDLGGASVRDSDDTHVYVIPAGTTVEPGAFLVLDELDTNTGAGAFDFGLGKADSVRLFDASGALVDQVSWTAHAAQTLGLTPAGEWAETLEPTKGAENRFAEPTEPEPAATLRLSEVDSQPADWVELVNTGTEAFDLAGYELRDNSDDHSWKFPAGATLAGGAYLVVDENSLGTVGAQPGLFREAIGIGSADQIRLFDPAGTLIDDTSAWTAHAALGGDTSLATLARCTGGTGPFVLAHPTPGAANRCATDTGGGDGGGDGGGETPGYVNETWPGAAAVTAVDATQMFREDSSGLDTQATADGLVLWAVDNGEGRFWKLNAQADGSASFAPGWAEGKRARFQKDADNPRAAGPDTEGITAANDGFIYLASERDNSAKGVNFNVVMQIDPEAAGPDVVATTEWDLTALLPQVSANLGIEAVEWVADADLAGKLVDANTGAGYDPAAYPLHGDGLFFVAVEDGGQVFAFALNSDGSAQRVAEVKPGLSGVMALDWDTVRGGLWAVCDDGCQGDAAFLTLNGTATPEVTHYARPAELPNANNEGFATAPLPASAATAPAAAAPAAT
uniref:lamin tail domain-containing protein n=1 Tax=Leucobacter chromiireducens TaxID=283877 RepID=UPI001F14C1CD